MAGDSKTEKASPKKREDQRKKGNVFQSKDVAVIVSLLIGFYGLQLLSPGIVREVRRYLTEYIGLIGTLTEVNSNLITEMSAEFMVSCAKTLLPIMFLLFGAGILGSGVQTRFLFSGENLKPKFSRMNPLEGIKKMFSMRNVIELIKGILKLSLLAVVIYQFIRGHLVEFARTMSMDVAEAAASIPKIVMQMMFPIFICFTAISAFDFFYQWWDYEQQIKMSKQEVKEEYKQLEGNPEIKGKIKEKQRAMARNRMMQAVPDADVVIKNPTHFAVALRYNMEKDRAPVVLAKGQDELALRIIHVAEEHQVHVVENIPLARALYAATEVNREIPAEFYSAIAEVLVYIYQMDNKDLSGFDS